MFSGVPEIVVSGFLPEIFREPPGPMSLRVRLLKKALRAGLGASDPNIQTICCAPLRLRVPAAAVACCLEMGRSLVLCHARIA